MPVRSTIPEYVDAESLRRLCEEIKFTTIGAGGGTGAVVPRIMGLDRKTQKFNWLHTSYENIGTLGIGGYLGIWTPK